MPRVVLVLLAVLISLPATRAQNRENESVANVLAVQNALYQGRQHLLKGEARQAVDLLESKLPYINGNRDYLATLRDAYWALLKELQRDRKEDKIPQVLERLRLLDPNAKLDGYAPAAPARPAAPESPAPTKLAASPDGRKARAQADDSDPFQQAPLLEKSAVRDLLRRAEAAYRQEHDAEAAQLFREAFVKDPDSLGPTSREHWGYCRLHLAVARLNQAAPADRATIAAVETEVREALALASDKSQLGKFAQTVLDRIHERTGGALPAAPSSSAGEVGWTKTESASFRVLHHQPPDAAEQFLVQAEKARRAAFEKWFGQPPTDWAPRCDVYLHATAADYSQATKGHPQSHGHSTVEIRDGKVVRRRLDLVADHVGLLPAALPREVTHLVLADLFSDPLLPRWADEAMAILAEPRANVDRFTKAIPRLRNEGRFVPVGKFITTAEFPDPAAITAFYVQCVSLTDMLVALRGPRAFAIFLQDSRRYGYEKALERNYNIRTFNELQDRWQRHAFAQ